jgi:mono/diheme cytochrome c family protein
MSMRYGVLIGALVLIVASASLGAGDVGARAQPKSPSAVQPEPPATAAPSADRGRAALLERCFSAPFVSRAGYETLWKQWGLKARPDDFDAQVRHRYGLHEPPYPNDGLPMGLRMIDRRRAGARAAVGIDCMLCHGGSLFGKSYIGLPNTSLDLAGLFRDLDLASGSFGIFPYRVSNVRGTTESTATGVFVISLRDGELNFRLPPAPVGRIPDQLCEDAPAWWLLRRKRTMYYNGQIDARAVRPLMTFMLHPGSTPATFAREESTFADIRQYLLTLEPPKYPLPVDAPLASRGRIVFENNCSKCHGAYAAGDCASGPDGYPNRIVPLEKIGTDPSLVRGLTPAIEDHFRQSWFTRERGPQGEPYPLRYNAGYQAPPLDGVWATAPYLHNGSVPTLYHLLKADQRPRVFTRSYRTAPEDYDFERVGWKVTEIPEAPRAATPRDARQIYDTTKPGRSNTGHTFGDALDDAERRAVIEYLKTL